MLPTLTTPLNERLIRVMIEEHQAEIRRCFVPRPGTRRLAPGALLLRLGLQRRGRGESSPHQGTVLTTREMI
jgi:hypothetical protein